MKVLRTPDDRFADLPDFTYVARYLDVADGDGGQLRMHYVAEGDPDAPVVVLLHGEPTWSYLWRHVIRALLEADLRAVAVDLVGFGRSDKPTEVGDHTYARHVEWVRVALFDELALEDVTLVCQDWGGLVGLRLVAEHPDRFARVVAANTGLPTGDQQMPEAWLKFRDWILRTDDVPVGWLVARSCETALSDEVIAAYDAPFPDVSYKAAVRAMPQILPTTTTDPATTPNRNAWAALAKFDKPFLTAFSDKDPITKFAEPILRQVIPGARDQPHTTIENAGHMLQEDAGERLGQVVAQFVRST